jgi:hypothetical protein
MNVGGRLYALVAECAGLDFLNAFGAASRRGRDAMHDCDSLLRWLEQKKLVSSDAIESIRANTSSEELAAVSAEASWARGFEISGTISRASRCPRAPSIGCSR